MKTTINSTVTVPSAYITKHKQRIKQFEDAVYLNNGDEFEIELYNPTQNKVLAKIEINGNTVGDSGIIIRPGERVFLERYINEAKKFLFETYNVNGDDSSVQKAIENNGNVSVKFYKEYITITSNFLSTSGTGSLNFLNTTHNSNLFNTTHNANVKYFTNTIGLVYPTSSTFVSGLNNTTISSSLPKKSKQKTIETGRVEKGSNSDQKFVYDSSTFESWNTWNSNWKILPNSQKPVVIEDLKTFCTECGVKRKKDSHKFCPICGTKY